MAFSKEDIKGIIYMIGNTVNENLYIGQTRTHYKNGEKYIEFGAIGRFKDHIKEAFYDPENGCRHLNRAILKYGADEFWVKQIYECNLKFLNHFEQFYVYYYDSFKNGYNMNEGGLKKYIDPKTGLLKNGSAFPFKEHVAEGNHFSIKSLVPNEEIDDVINNIPKEVKEYQAIEHSTISFVDNTSIWV